MIERNIALEARLIDDLLDLTRIAKGKLPLREELVRCALAARPRRGDRARRSAGEAGHLELDLAARRTGLRADPARLQQVFWNLLRNAIKFTPAGGPDHHPHAAMKPTAACASRCSDTGIGLPPDALETIFRPFEQAGRENDHQFGGLGLGLAIARAIVDLHGGELTAQSDGTRQRRDLHRRTARRPRAGHAASIAARSRDHASASSDADRPARAATCSSWKITSRRLTVLRRLLSRAGHQVVAAGSIAAALSPRPKRMPFDFVISDLGLPDGTGLELMSKLRASSPACAASRSPATAWKTICAARRNQDSSRTSSSPWTSINSPARCAN